MKRVVLALLLSAAPGAAFAGLDVPGQAPISYTDAQAVAAVQGAGIIPSPYLSIPAPEIVGGQAGSAGVYMPSNARPPRITRAATVTTDGSGNWSVTWADALPATPITMAFPINSGSLPVMCNTITTTTTGATGKCWSANTQLLNLSLVTSGLTLNLWAGSASGISAQILAIPTTQ